MFNVNMRGLMKSLEHRNLTHTKNSDGTVTINGKVFDRESEVERYLEAIPRKDLPNN